MKYDLVIMNPPYNQGMWFKFLEKAELILVLAKGIVQNGQINSLNGPKHRLDERPLNVEQEQKNIATGQLHVG